MAAARRRANDDAAPARPGRRTAGAVVGAWVLPGLGHVLLGRVGRGLLFGAVVWTCFGLGLAHEGRIALRDARQPFLTTLQVVANLGVGPADVVARIAVYGAPAYTLRETPSAAGRPSVASVFRSRARSGASLYGTAYLWTAGLMNLLLLFDVWDLGRGRQD